MPKIHGMRTESRNIQHRTSNIQWALLRALFDVRRWMVDVGCWMFFHCSIAAQSPVYWTSCLDREPSTLSRQVNKPATPNSRRLKVPSVWITVRNA